MKTIKRDNANLKINFQKESIPYVGESLTDYYNLISDYLEFSGRTISNIELTTKISYSSKDELGLTTDFWVEVAQGKYK